MTAMSLPETFADSGREYWRGVLLSGGFTAIPRWTAEPVPGIAQHEAAIPGDLVDDLRRATYDLLGVLRIYTKVPGKPVDRSKPMTVPIPSRPARPQACTTKVTLRR